MKKKLLKILFLKYKDIFYDFIVEDFYGEIPDKVKDPGVVTFGQKSNLVEKFLYYQAFYLSRRISKDAKSNEMVFGMLLQIKLILRMIGGFEGQQIKEEKPDKKQQDDGKTDLDKDLERVDKFMKGVDK